MGRVKDNGVEIITYGDEDRGCTIHIRLDDIDNRTSVMQLIHDLSLITIKFARRIEKDIKR